MLVTFLSQFEVFADLHCTAVEVPGATWDLLVLNNKGAKKC